MSLSEITFPFLLSQILNIVITLAWLMLVALALRSLRRRYLSDEAKALWAALILIIPFLGAIALWLVVPNRPLEHAVVVSTRHLSSSLPREPRRASVDLKGVEFGPAIHGHSSRRS